MTMAESCVCGGVMCIRRGRFMVASWLNDSAHMDWGD